MEKVVTKKKRSKLKITLLTVLTLLVLVSVAGLAYIPHMIIGPVIGHHIEREVYEPEEYGIEAERLTLETDDGLNIAAWLTDTEAPRGTIIILSGIENPSVTAFFSYAKIFMEMGYDSLLIEMRAHNASEGEEVALGMKEWLDVKAGVEYLRQDGKRKDLPIIAMGTSMGGATVLIATGELPEIDGVISISAFSSWPDVFEDSMVMMGLPQSLASVERPFVNMYVGFHYGFDNLKYTAIEGIAKLSDRPVLLMHSTEDSEVPYPSYERLLAKAIETGNSNISTFVREGDEHFIVYSELFDDPVKDTEFFDTVEAFLYK